MPSPFWRQSRRRVHALPYLRLFALALAIGASAVAPAKGDLCIYDVVEVEALRGRVYVRYQGKCRPGEGVTVSATAATGKDQRRIVTTTDSKGDFHIRARVPGDYLLTFEEPAGSLHARVRLASKRSSPDVLLAVLDLEGCGRICRGTGGAAGCPCDGENE